MISFSPTLLWSDFLSFFKKNKEIEKKFLRLFCKDKKEKLFFFSRSSWAIYSVILLKKNPCVFVPDFYCDEAIFLLRKLKIKIVFYKINKNNSINLDDLKNKAQFKKPDIIIYCNFFGKNYFEPYLYDLKKKYDAWLIEDATHCLIPNKDIGNKGDFIIFSPYKFVPIPMGSVMKCNSSIIEKIHHGNDSNIFLDKISRSKIKYPSIGYNFYYNFLWLLKQFYRKLGLNYLEIQSFDYDHYINSENEMFNPKLDNFVKKIMMNFLINYQDIKKKRLQMFDIIKTLIDQKKYLFSHDVKINNLKFVDHPYMIEIEGDHKYLIKFYNRLKNLKLPILTWPSLPLEIKKKESESLFAIYNRNSKFYIPLHYQPHNFIKNLSVNKEQEKNVDFLQIDNSEWSNLFDKCPKKNIINSLDYLNSQKKILNINNTKYKIVIDNNIVGIFTLLEKKFLFFKYLRVNRGPLFLGKDVDIQLKSKVLKKIIDFTNKYAFSIFNFSPELENFSHEFLIDNKKNSFLFNGVSWESSLLDLTKDISEIHKNLNQKWRNSLNIFNKKNIVIHEEKSQESFELVIKYYARLQKEKNFKGIDIKFLNYYLNNSNKIVYFAYLEEKFIGYMCVSSESSNSTYLLGYANDMGRKVNVMNGLMWNTIVDLKKKNYANFDLGGLDYINTPGIYKFKSGVNGKKYKLIGSYKRINLL